MWFTTRRCCAAAATSSSSSIASNVGAAAAAASTTTNPSLATSVSLNVFDKWLQNSSIRVEEQGVKLVPRALDSRGMIAMKPFREGVTVLSVPMSSMAITAEKLLQQSSFLRETMKPPTFDEVRRELSMFSVRDPVLHQQMYLAMTLAGERMNPNSLFTPYFDMLPYPAIDDGAVIAGHKDALQPMQLLEWDDHQRVFLTTCRALHQRWASRTTQAPPVPVIYWAFRTVLSRMHMLPDRGLAPPETNRRLNYAAFTSLRQVGEQESFLRRSVQTVKSLFSSDPITTDFRLVPTLMPVIDMAGHLSSGNVSVEVQPRPGQGSCVELQAVAAIKEGEPIGMCLNRSQSIAFTLYRFGFLPM